MPGINYSAHQYNPIAQGAGAAMASAKAPARDSGFSFGDLLDVINPLQHIPVISTLYRHLTGDTIGTGAKLAGDTLYGGVTGLICSAADSAFEEVTGKGVGDTVYAALFGDDKVAPDQPATGFAAADQRYFAGARFGEKNIAIGSQRHEAGTGKSGDIGLDRKALRHLRQGPGGARHGGGMVVDARRGVRRGKRGCR